MGEIVLRIEGLEFHADGKEDEPRVLDVDIGLRAGMGRPRDVRKVIKTQIANGFLNGSDVRAVSARQKVGNIQQEVTSYWLTEAGALKVITKLETAAAHAMVGDMIRVYREAIRQLREPIAAEPKALPASPEDVAHAWAAKLPNLAFIRDNPVWAEGLKFQIGYVALRCGMSWQAVEGWLRKPFRAVSYLAIPAFQLSVARQLLEQAGTGEVLIRRRIEALPADTRQQKMFEVN